MSEQSVEELQVGIGIFRVRNDKNRGILIETLKTEDSELYFFKHHEQSLDKHCEQVQQIVKAANVKRVKNVRINLSAFPHEYFHLPEKTVVFKGTKLNSVHNQIEKVYTKKLRKEIGAKKRKITVAPKKQEKINEEYVKILARIATVEKQFQADRAKRIHELFGEAEAPGSGGQAFGSGGQASGSGGQASASVVQAFGNADVFDGENKSLPVDDSMDDL